MNITASLPPVAVFLCNLTENAAEPWLNAGYEVHSVDPQHEIDHASGSHIYHACTVREFLRRPIASQLLISGRIRFVGSFPPCDDVASCGARWWDGKRQEDPYFQAKASVVAEQCRTFSVLSAARWFLENPKGAFSSILGKPDHFFHPWHYAGFYPHDCYTKETFLWTGGGFVMPEPKIIPDQEPDDRIHKAAPGPDRKNFRAATPRGFSRAVFEANTTHNTVSGRVS